VQNRRSVTNSVHWGKLVIYQDSALKTKNQGKKAVCVFEKAKIMYQHGIKYFRDMHHPASQYVTTIPWTPPGWPSIVTNLVSQSYIPPLNLSPSIITIGGPVLSVGKTSVPLAAPGTSYSKLYPTIPSNSHVAENFPNGVVYPPSTRSKSPNCGAKTQLLPPGLVGCNPKT
jgi:hypothetical protein